MNKVVFVIVISAPAPSPSLHPVVNAIIYFLGMVCAALLSSTRFLPPYVQHHIISPIIVYLASPTPTLTAPKPIPASYTFGLSSNYISLGDATNQVLYVTLAHLLTLFCLIFASVPLVTGLWRCIYTSLSRRKVQMDAVELGMTADTAHRPVDYNNKMTLQQLEQGDAAQFLLTELLVSDPIGNASPLADDLSTSDTLLTSPSQSSEGDTIAFWPTEGDETFSPSKESLDGEEIAEMEVDWTDILASSSIFESSSFTSLHDPSEPVGNVPREPAGSTPDSVATVLTESTLPVDESSPHASTPPDELVTSDVPPQVDNETVGYEKAITEAPLSVLSVNSEGSVFLETLPSEPLSNTNSDRITTDHSLIATTDDDTSPDTSVSPANQVTSAILTPPLANEGVSVISTLVEDNEPFSNDSQVGLIVERQVTLSPSDECPPNPFDPPSRPPEQPKENAASEPETTATESTDLVSTVPNTPELPVVPLPSPRRSNSLPTKEAKKQGQRIQETQSLTQDAFLRPYKHAKVPEANEAGSNSSGLLLYFDPPPPSQDCDGRGETLSGQLINKSQAEPVASSTLNADEDGRWVECDDDNVRLSSIASPSRFNRNAAAFVPAGAPTLPSICHAASPTFQPQVLQSNAPQSQLGVPTYELSSNPPSPNRRSLKRRLPPRLQELKSSAGNPAVPLETDGFATQTLMHSRAFNPDLIDSVLLPRSPLHNILSAGLPVSHPTSSEDTSVLYHAVPSSSQTAPLSSCSSGGMDLAQWVAAKLGVPHEHFSVGSTSNGLSSSAQDVDNREGKLGEPVQASQASPWILAASLPVSTDSSSSASGDEHPPRPGLQNSEWAPGGEYAEAAKRERESEQKEKQPRQQKQGPRRRGQLGRVPAQHV